MSTKTIKNKLIKQKQYLEPDSDENKAINAYLNSQVGKFGSYFALPNALVHRVLDCDYREAEGTVLQSIIAMDLNGHKIGNSSMLPWINSRVLFGKRDMGSGVTTIQTKISQFITMIPFSVFNEAQLDIRKLNILDKGCEETVTVKIDNPKYDYKSPDKYPQYIDESRHFTGACLFEVEGRVFLFDIDREEIKHKIFNAFLSEIPVKVKTIKDAYRALKPADVLIAEAEGLNVRRQGEWFFIPVKGEYEPDKSKNRFSDKIEIERIGLRAGDNRPNYAEQGVKEKGLVRGKVKHSGREHRTIQLKTWHKAVPNTAIKSFTIIGDID